MQGTIISASWTYNDTPIDGFVGSIQAEEDGEDVWVEFHLNRSTTEPWPAGNYAIVIAVNEQPAQTAVVTVAAGLA